MSKCEMHKVELLPGRCEIRRGMPPAPPAGYYLAKETIFPNANTWDTGGCVITPEDENDEPVQFCPACRAAERIWEADLDADDFWRSSG